MKYIRTRNGVYKYLNNSRITKTGLWEVATDCGSEGFFGSFKGEVIKQADTIEELCDEFYIDYGKSRFPYSTYRQHERYAGYGDLMRYLREIHFAGYDGVYGYIWVGNELKLVAKMNDKGEFELL